MKKFERVIEQEIGYSITEIQSMFIYKNRMRRIESSKTDKEKGLLSHEDCERCYRSAINPALY